MTYLFEYSPLVELVAELRWAPIGVKAPSEGPAANSSTVQFLPANANLYEEFFMRFGAAVNQNGFQRAERVVPAGIPLMAYQPAYRFRRSEEVDSAVIYQVGAGMFSANAIPPYKSWDAFSPVVKDGIDALLASRSETEKTSHFNTITLRYLNAFGPDFVGEHDVQSFVSEVLGFKFDLPGVLLKHIAAGGIIKPFALFQFPLSNGMSMSVSVGQALVKNEVTLAMDTNIRTTTETAPDSVLVMNVLNQARGIIHETFFELTRPIHAVMRTKRNS